MVGWHFCAANVGTNQQDGFVSRIYAVPDVVVLLSAERTFSLLTEEKYEPVPATLSSTVGEHFGVNDSSSGSLKSYERVSS
jgi:hypothetical protein